jgi:hypothetical protein
LELRIIVGRINKSLQNCGCADKTKSLLRKCYRYRELILHLTLIFLIGAACGTYPAPVSPKQHQQLLMSTSSMKTAP